jgi:Flp pilus assembly protein TadG
MIIRKPSSWCRRGGATTVEASVVISVFLLFLFGLFEYCRFIFFLHVATNAARDGARYAVVNVDKPTNFDYFDTVYGGTTYTSIKGYVDNRIASNGKMLTGYQVEVFPCDNGQLSQTTPIVARKSAAANPTAPRNPTSPYGSELAWNAATFGERIAVRINGTYRPVLPNFILMRSTYNMEIIVTANSEG